MSALGAVLAWASPGAAVAKRVVGAIPARAWLGIAACLVLLALRWHWIGVGEDRVRVEFDAYRDRMIAATEKAKDAAHRAESAQAGAIAAAVDIFRKEKTDAKETGKSVTAGVRSGSLKLRHEWQGCPRVLPQAPAGAGERDEAADLRATGSGDLVRLAAEADAVIRQNQAIIASACPGSAQEW